METGLPNTLEKLFIEVLKTRKKESLLYWINNNLSLSKWLSEEVSPEIMKITRMAFMIMGNNGINSKVVLEYLKIHRPDLVEVITFSEKNMRWFEKQVVQVKKLFGV